MSCIDTLTCLKRQLLKSTANEQREQGITFTAYKSNVNICLSETKVEKIKLTTPSRTRNITV